MNLRRSFSFDCQSRTAEILPPEHGTAVQTPLVAHLFMLDRKQYNGDRFCYTSTDNHSNDHVGFFLQRKYFPKQRMEQTRSLEGNHRRCQLSIKRTFPFLFVIGLISILAGAQEKQLRKPDVIYEPSPQTVVERMLVLANVNNYDIVYDLGCGDGRIVITAAKIFRATGVGIDIDPVRIQESLQNAEKAGVTDRVSFRNEDFFEADIREATVVTLFLSPRANMKLRPKLLDELKPGTRVVSYYWDMGDWEPDKQIEVDGEPIYMWTIPEKESEGREIYRDFVFGLASDLSHFSPISIH